MSIKIGLCVSLALVALCTGAFSQENAPLTDCDKYAGSPFDPRMKGGGTAPEKIDPKLAIPACEEAVQNYPKAVSFWFQLGRAYFAAKNDAQAAAWVRKAADEGNPLAQQLLAYMYYNGRGLPQDFAQALLWSRKAADQGNALGQVGVGSMYENGLGVPQDFAQALSWYRKAADQGNAIGQSRLGFMYLKGAGVPQDYAQALSWYRKAADQGNDFAKKQIEIINANLNRDPNDVVAQILNYSRVGNDNGTDSGYYFKVRKCVYKFYSPLTEEEPFNLDELDPRLITFTTYPNRTETKYDNRIIFSALSELNIGRLERGWSLIYATHCSGKQKAF